MEVDEEITYNVRVRVIEAENRQEYTIDNRATVTVGDKSKSDDATVEILYSNIEIEKRASVDEIRPGDSFTYTITVTNDGTGRSEELSVIDELDSDLIFDYATPSSYSSLGGNSYQFDLDPLEAGESVTITLHVTLNDNTTKTNILNEAIVCESGQDDWDQCLRDEVIIPVVDSNIIIEKIASDTEVRIGDTFSYEIRVINNGNAASKEIVVTDTLDSRLSLIRTDKGNIRGNTLTYTISSLDIGEAETITVTAQVLNTAESNDIINNTAIAEEEGKIPVRDEEEITVIDSNVTITKTASKSIVNVGEEFTYTITIENTSDYASRQITVTDTINSNLEIISAPNGSINGNTITYNVGILEAHGNRTYTVVVKARNSINDNTTITNTAILKEVGKEDQEDDVDVTIVKPNLSVIKTAVTNTSNNYVNPGEEYTYQITVRNTGHGNAENVVITDEIDNRLTLIDADGGTVNGRTITWNENIDASSSITLTIRVRVNNNVANNTVIPNKVIVTHNDEEIEDDDEVTVTDSVITLNKVASVEQVLKEEEFYYTITVSNIGTDTETNLTLTDDIPDELTILRVDAPAGITENINNQKITLNINSIRPSETYEILIYVKVTGDVSDNDRINNTAILTYGDEELTSSDDIVIIDSNLTVEKTSSKAYASIGDEYTYTITISNNGNARARNVEVIDTYDEYLEIIDADNGNIDEDNHTITWNIVNLDAKESIQYTIRVKVNSNVDKEIILNQVVVHEPDKPDKEDEVEVFIGDPTLTITKESNVTQVTKGGEFEYVITIENTSEYNVENLRVTDTFDDRLIIIDNDGGIISGNEITWEFDLPANSSITFNVLVKVLDEVEEGEIPNVAILHQEDEDIPSNEVVVEIVDVINPQTGNIIKYSLIIVFIAIAGIIIVYTKKKGKIFRI